MVMSQCDIFDIAPPGTAGKGVGALARIGWFICPLPRPLIPSPVVPMKLPAVLVLCAASVLSAIPAVGHAQLQTCIEAGKRVIRQGACPSGVREGTGTAAAPAARPATYVTQVLGHTLLVIALV
jgi:hypothetical protein